MRTLALIFVPLLSIACGDMAPGPAVVSMSPANPTTTDDLTASVDKEALDPEGDKLTYSYVWYVDGVANDGLSSNVAPAEITARGDVWRVEITANDGSSKGPAMGAEVTIGNTAPSVTLSIAPALPVASDDIVVTAETTDIDGDSVSLDWSWTRDGQPTGHSEGTIPAADTGRWQTWEVTVVPSDDDLSGEPVTASVVVQNNPPLVYSVELSPTEAYEDSIIRAAVSAEDIDYDGIELLYAWYVDDELAMESSGNTLTGAYFDKHQQVLVRVTASDGYEDSEPFASDPVEILNSAPTLTSVSIDPTVLYEGSTATCLTDGLDDVDDDELTVSYSWTVNGSEVSTDASIDGSSFDRGDTVSCSAAVNDGEVDGPSASSDTLEVLNTLPVVVSVVLSPSPIYTADDVVATVSGAADEDDDTVSLSYAWWVGSSMVSTDTSLTSVMFDKHDDIELVVTPSDGIEAGTAVSSGISTVANSLPVFTDLEVEPGDAVQGGTLTAYPSGWSDADGDLEAYQYQWYVDGSAADTSASIDLTAMAIGTQVYVEVSAYDGEDAGTMITSSVLGVRLVTDADAADVVLLGDVGDEAGTAVAMCADITGDGEADVAVGASEASLGGAGAGVVYIATSVSDADIDLGTDAESIIYGDAGDELGAFLSFAGDVDGNGFDDLLIGAPGHSSVGADGGAAYLLPGPVWGTQAVTTAAFELLGQAASDAAGSAVTGLGDLDADGYDDFAVGAYGADSDTGAAYIFYGPLTASGTLGDAHTELAGETAGDQAGCSVGSAGDTDGDGLADLIVGAQAESSAGSGFGAAYLVLGPVSASGDLGAVASLKLTGEGIWDNAGYSVAGAGDVDGDGLDDVLVAAQWEDTGGTSSGACYLALGGTTGTVSLTSTQAKLIGTSASELVGSSLAAAGDVDLDGFDDIVVGASGGDTNGSLAGAAYFIQGPLTGSLDLDADVEGTLRVDGVSLGDRLGTSVAGGVDLDSDGQPEILLGAPHDDGNGTSSGAAFLFFGSSL